MTNPKDKKKQNNNKKEKEVFTKEDFLNALKKTTAPLTKPKEQPKTKND